MYFGLLRSLGHASLLALRFGFEEVTLGTSFQDYYLLLSLPLQKCKHKKPTFFNETVTFIHHQVEISTPSTSTTLELLPGDLICFGIPLQDASAAAYDILGAISKPTCYTFVEVNGDAQGSLHLCSRPIGPGFR